MQTTSDLFGVVPGPSRASIYSKLATLTVGMGAIDTTPVPLHADCPAFGFSVLNRLLNLLVGGAWSSH